ncbi:MAG: DUF2971 domain-containing protein [Gammaproteobacteria bacterium]|nr:DUF2971 domain-containing protein [Gammaproteobacteria bacterium]
MERYYKYKRWPEDKPENKVERERVLDIILNKRMRLSVLEKLNDPFEGNLLAIDNIDKIPEDLDTKAFHEALVCLDDKWRESIARFKVLCLSKKPGIPLMWSHYADSHRGLCIAITLNSHAAESMRYLDTTKDINEYISEPPDCKKALLTKYKYWQYEEEHRVICDSELEDDYIPIEPVELILGWRMKQSERKFWFELAHGIDLRVSRAIVTGNPIIDRIRSNAIILAGDQ